MTDDSAARVLPDPPEHVIFDRDDFENRVGMTYCRRCGRPVVNDRFPEKVTKHPCEVVRIAFR